jgi:hypothetical protein
VAHAHLSVPAPIATLTVKHSFRSDRLHHERDVVNVTFA